MRFPRWNISFSQMEDTVWSTGKTGWCLSVNWKTFSANILGAAARVLIIRSWACWFFLPNCRYGFSHRRGLTVYEEYTYRIPVEIDDGWQTSSLNEEGVDAEKINELMQRILIGHDQVKNVHSVLLVKNGKLALEEYFYGTHRSHMHSIQSDTKSVISVLMGIAAEKGFIKKDQQVITCTITDTTCNNNEHWHRVTSVFYRSRQ